MGGKVWSDIEEEIFWNVLARNAPPGFHKESKAKKKNRHDLAKSWEPLIEVMKNHMLQKNPAMTPDELPRRYSAISIYEHWFQNLVQGKHSPHAKRHVRAHQAWLKSMAEDPECASEPLEPLRVPKKRKLKAQQRNQQQQALQQQALQQQVQKQAMQQIQPTPQQIQQRPVQLMQQMQPVQTHQQPVHQMQQMQPMQFTPQTHQQLPVQQMKQVQPSTQQQMQPFQQCQGLNEVTVFPQQAYLQWAKAQSSQKGRLNFGQWMQPEPIQQSHQMPQCPPYPAMPSFH